MPRAQVQNLQYNPNIDKQIIHNLAHLLYSNEIDHVSGKSRDRQLSGLHPSS